VLLRIIALIVASIIAVSIVAVVVTASPVYSVAQVRVGLMSAPTSWIGRTVRVRASDSYPGGRVAWLVDPGDSYNPYAKGLPVTAGPWQAPTFPRRLIWWLGSNVHVLQGIDGGRVEVYRITLTKPLRGACATCGVGHG
jgi:hypothetical protein